MPKGYYERKRTNCDICDKDVAITTLSRHKKTHERTDGLTYWAYHWRVRRERGTPSFCEECGTTDSDVGYEWASITKDYADMMDYRRLCKPCHTLFDGNGKRNWRLNPSQPVTHERRSEWTKRGAETRQRNGSAKGGRPRGSKNKKVGE